MVSEDGKGLFTTGGVKYFGNWKNGIKKEGELRWPNADIYTGKHLMDWMSVV